MGGSKKYLEEGGFTEQTYKRVGEIVNGIKVLERTEPGKPNLPMHSNTPYNRYARTDDTGKVNQITYYGGKDGRTKAKEIDTGHTHANKSEDGKIEKLFRADEIHVHIYINGVRQQKARKPSKRERRDFMAARVRRIKT